MSGVARIAAALILLPCCAVAEVHTWNWAPPTTGSPAVAYEVELRDNWGWVAVRCQVPDTTVTLDQGNMIARLRCRGIDAQDRIGQWSAWSGWSVPMTIFPFYSALGARFGVPGLTFAVRAVAQLQESWPE